MCRPMRWLLAMLVLTTLAVGGALAEPAPGDGAAAGQGGSVAQAGPARSGDDSAEEARPARRSAGGQADTTDTTDASDPGNAADEQPAMRDVAYLGVSVEPLGETLRAQLDLPEGVGLSVAYVVKGSPADAAGLKRHDVLHKFDDQLLISVYQLKVLVRVFGPGAEGEFELIRKGKRVTLPVTLGRRRVSVEASQLDPPSAGYAEALNERGAAPALPPEGTVAAREGAVRISTRQMSFTDGEHKLIVREDQQGRHLRAVNRDGEVLYDGYLKDANGAALPATLQRKLDRLEAIQQRYPMSGAQPLQADPTGTDAE